MMTDNLTWIEAATHTGHSWYVRTAKSILRHDYPSYATVRMGTPMAKTILQMYVVVHRPDWAIRLSSGERNSLVAALRAESWPDPVFTRVQLHSQDLKDKDQ